MNKLEGSLHSIREGNFLFKRIKFDKGMKEGGRR